MPSFTIRYDEAAREDLDQLPVKYATQIVKKISRLQFGLQGDIKHLQEHEVAYRLRMGDYRVLFDIDGQRILIRRVKHRKEAYD